MTPPLNSQKEKYSIANFYPRSPCGERPACGIKRRVKPMNDEMILSPEMDEELSNGKGEDENE